MANNEVFVNGLEVACKAADGKSVAAFPDPCWSPPFPSAGPIVIPYANTAYAKNLTNATKTVMITGKPVAQKDKSYFKTSTGNEAATNAFAKGYMSHVIKGKAYFRSWSMNVFVEGYNVCRHTDGMTHNHGSTTNTAYWHYLDTASPSGVCEKNARKISKACGEEIHDPKKEPDKQNAQKREKSIFSSSKTRLKKRKAEGKSGKDESKEKTSWKERNCAGLMISPFYDSNKEAAFKKKRNEFKKDLEGVNERLEELTDTAIDNLIDEVKEKVEKTIAKKVAAVAVRSAAKSWLGPIGWVWTAYDVVSSGMTINDLLDELDELRDTLKTMRQELPELRKIAKNATNLDEKGLANAMEVIANINPCTRARRCKLVPFNASNGKAKTQGCCPGQTKHHIIPKAFFKKSDEAGSANVSECRKYNAFKAPTICLEGSSHSKGGSHAKIHGKIKKYIGKLNIPVGDNISYAQTKKACLDSVERIAPQCDRDCIEKQLDAYHKQVCKADKGLFELNEDKAITLRRAKTPGPSESENDEGSIK
ncbi:MAG: DUF4150 domain-containing protein [Pasteurella sp.]|nr:DUF4150 domain-containing protein [Pasteurella sp.]